MAGDWTPEPFEADDGTIPFERFVDGLSDFKFVALDTAVDRVLSVRGIDLVRTEWLKALGGGLHEFRVRHDADEVARNPWLTTHGEFPILLRRRCTHGPQLPGRHGGSP